MYDKLKKMFTQRSNRVCVYGAPGVGKTQAVAELAKHREIVYLDTDGNIEPFEMLTEEQLGNVTYVPLMDVKMGGSMTAVFHEAMESGKIVVCEKHGLFGCLACRKNKDSLITVDLLSLKDENKILVLDSFSPLLMAAAADMRRATGLTTLDSVKIQQMGIMSNRLNPILFFLTHLPCDVLILAHRKNVNTELDSRNSKPPFYYPNLGTVPASETGTSYFKAVIGVESYKKFYLNPPVAGYYCLNRGSKPTQGASLGDVLLSLFNN